MKCFSATYIQYLWDEIGQVIKSRKLGPINQVKVDNEWNSQSGSHLRANAQKNRAKSANRGHSSKPNLLSFSVCNKVLMSL